VSRGVAVKLITIKGKVAKRPPTTPSTESRPKKQQKRLSRAGRVKELDRRLLGKGSEDSRGEKNGSSAEAASHRKSTY